MFRSRARRYRKASIRAETVEDSSLPLLEAAAFQLGLPDAMQGLVEKNRESYPTVASRAQVEVGNAMVAAGDFKGARAFFDGILEEGKGGDGIIASAISGLGDCAYLEALSLDSPKEQVPFLEEAILNFLTVASVYREEVRLVPRAMFYAGDALKRIGDSGSARNVASRIRNLYPDSTWKKRLFQELGLK